CTGRGTSSSPCVNSALGAVLVSRHSHAGRSGPCRRTAGVFRSGVQVLVDVLVPFHRPAARLTHHGIGVPLLDPAAPDELQQVVTANPHRPTPVAELVVGQLAGGAEPIDATQGDTQVTGD